MKDEIEAVLFHPGLFFYEVLIKSKNCFEKKVYFFQISYSDLIPVLRSPLLSGARAPLAKSLQKGMNCSQFRETTLKDLVRAETKP